MFNAKLKRMEFFKIIFFMFLPFSLIFKKNQRKRNNIKSEEIKSSPDYYLYM